jgi:hypothetical protein
MRSEGTKTMTTMTTTTVDKEDSRPSRPASGEHDDGDGDDNNNGNKERVDDDDRQGGIQHREGERRGCHDGERRATTIARGGSKGEMKTEKSTIKNQLSQH